MGKKQHAITSAGAKLNGCLRSKIVPAAGALTREHLLYCLAPVIAGSSFCYPAAMPAAMDSIASGLTIGLLALPTLIHAPVPGASSAHVIGGEAPPGSKSADFQLGILQLIAAKLPLIVIVSDHSGKIRTANRPAREIIGNDVSHLSDVFELFTPDIDQRALLHWFHAARHDQGVTDPEAFRLKRVVSSGRSSYYDSTICRAGARNGRPDFVFCALETTEQHHAQEVINHASRLAMIGEMATGLTHELNQSLNVIGLAAENAIRMLETADRNSRDIKQKLERIKTQVHASGKIIRNLRFFGRRDSTTFDQFQPVEPVHYAVSLIEADITRLNIGVEIHDTCPAAIRCIGQLSEIQQVILNILINARDAFEASARSSLNRIVIQIAADSRQLQVIYRIRDNAGGIKEQILPTIFQPFVTSKPAGKGTGLGLSISYGIVSQHKGSIEARNIEGGALFEIRLPATTGA